MIVYFSTRKRVLLGMASTNLRGGFVITDDEMTWDVETGVGSFSCKLSFGGDKDQVALQQMTEVGNYILVSNGQTDKFGHYCDSVYTVIDSEIDNGKQEIYIYCEDAGLDLLNETAPEYEADKSYTAQECLNRFLASTGFEIGIDQFNDATVRKLKWTGEGTVIERIQSIANSFGGMEIQFAFQVKNLRIVKQFINIYKKRGDQSGSVQLRMNQHIDSITVKKTIQNLATAFRCTGGTPEKSNTPINLYGYKYDDGNYYVTGTTVVSRKGAAKWKGMNTDSIGALVRQYSYDTLNQATLCSHAIAELKKIDDMEVNYDIRFKSLPDDIRIGDRVNIIDDRGQLYLSARILELKKSVTQQNISATLGEYKLKTSGISATVEKLAEQIANATSNVKLFTWIAYADDAFGTNITTDPAGKAFLGISTNQTVAEPDISDPTVYMWSEIQGVDGKAITMSISSSGGTTFHNASIQSQLVAHVYLSGVELSASEIADLGVLNWYDSSGTLAGTGQTLNVSRNEGTVTYQVRLEVDV